MDNTLYLFEDRRCEIEFYYSILEDLDCNSGKIQLSDNQRFFRILKSNFLLMLYNLIEACIVSGINEIYESLKQSEVCYDALIEDIQKLWSNYMIGEVYKSSKGQNSKTAYEKCVQKIINHIITKQPICLQRGAIDVSGNLDAKHINEICIKHKIIYRAKDVDGCLKQVKEKRQQLSHGDMSFGDCARDMTLKDIQHIMTEVLKFIKEVLDGMKDYYDNKRYLKDN